MFKTIKRLLGITWLTRVVKVAILHNQLVRQGVDVQTIAVMGDDFAVQVGDIDPLNDVLADFGRSVRTLITMESGGQLLSVTPMHSMREMAQVM